MRKSICFASFKKIIKTSFSEKKKNKTQNRIIKIYKIIIITMM